MRNARRGVWLGGASYSGGRCADQAGPSWVSGMMVPSPCLNCATFDELNSRSLPNDARSASPSRNADGRHGILAAYSCLPADHRHWNALLPMTGVGSLAGASVRAAILVSGLGAPRHTTPTQSGSRPGRLQEWRTWG
eukprot:scaffold31018_cov63-Phaeocystis_antarctica.AAC.21